MDIASYIAKRYLFSRKSTNAINIISSIAILGVSVGTGTLIIVMSVFNGFEDLITDLLNYFNPDIKVLPVHGKTFTIDSTTTYQLKGLDEVAVLSQVLEEVAFFEYKNNQRVGILKGVDEYYNEVTSISETIKEGEFKLREDAQNYAILGRGLQYGLGINIYDFINPVTVYMLRRKKIGNLDKAFKSRFVYPAGIFQVQQEYDNQYCIAPLPFVRELMEYHSELSSVEIRIAEHADLARAKEKITSLLGHSYVVKDRLEQEEAFKKIMRLEKWLGVAVLSLTLILVAFNIIGALWMLVLEKKKDISILKALGADNISIRKIFIYEGAYISGLGFLFGLIGAVAFYYLHKTYGIIELGSEYLIPAYPMELRVLDIVAVALIVAVISALASYIPSKRTERIPAYIETE